MFTERRRRRESRRCATEPSRNFLAAFSYDRTRRNPGTRTRSRRVSRPSAPELAASRAPSCAPVPGRVKALVLVYLVVRSRYFSDFIFSYTSIFYLRSNPVSSVFLFGFAGENEQTPRRIREKSSKRRVTISDLRTSGGALAGNDRTYSTCLRYDLTVLLSKSKIILRFRVRDHAYPWVREQLRGRWPLGQVPLEAGQQQVVQRRGNRVCRRQWRRPRGRYDAVEDLEDGKLSLGRSLLLKPRRPPREHLEQHASQRPHLNGQRRENGRLWRRRLARASEAEWLGAQWAGLFIGVQSCPKPRGVF